MSVDPLLYGHADERAVVCVHHSADDRMRLYSRTADGISRRDTEFFPFFHLADPTLLDGYTNKYWLKELSGEQYFRHIAAFTRWSDMWEAVRHIMDRYTDRLKVPAGTYQDVPALLLRPDPVSQYLMQSGVTLFKGMEFEEIHRFQLDIETYSGHSVRFSDPDRPEDRIILIALSDSRGYGEVLDGKKLSEPEMLSRLFEIIAEKDPDVIEGHNIYNFDLPYILRRCRMHGIEPLFGRDDIRMKPADGRQIRNERAMEVQIQDIPGRHIIDTWLLLQTYDHSRRKLESYGLKYAAQHFGFATENRVYINPNRISWTWDHEPEKLTSYAMDDVTETRLLSDLLSPPYFYLSQMTPFNYGTAARNGSATKIESMIIREYVRTRVSIPSPEPTHPTSGGYTDVFHTGVLGPILDIDVESLYPSIMLTDKIAPHSETLGVFTALLENLTKKRLKAKREMKSAKDLSLKGKLDAVQSSFKILINSFYGYLGYNRGLFNDSIAADRVTKKGQELLRGLITRIGEAGGKVVEVDTDGVFFVTPKGINTQKKELQFVEKLGATLPAGIVLALNGRYRAMLSYKAKNYALLGYDGRITIKGSSLTSRTIEKFGRNYIRQCIAAILSSDVSAIHEAYIGTYKAISSNQLDVSEFARTETLHDSPAEYRADTESGKRNKSAAYEAALRELENWRRGDKVSYYITGKDPSAVGFQNCRLADGWDPVDPDENTPFYLKRLDDISRKFEPFFSPTDFRKIFSPEDLFGFTPDGISIRTDSVVRGNGDDGDAEPELHEPRIWLDTQGGTGR